MESHGIDYNVQKNEEIGVSPVNKRYESKKGMTKGLVYMFVCIIYKILIVCR